MHFKQITLFLSALLCILVIHAPLLSMQPAEVSYSAEDIALLKSVGLTKDSNGAEVPLTAEEIFECTKRLTVIAQGEKLLLLPNAQVIGWDQWHLQTLGKLAQQLGINTAKKSFATLKSMENLRAKCLALIQSKEWVRRSNAVANYFYNQERYAWRNALEEGLSSQLTESGEFSVLSFSALLSEYHYRLIAPFVKKIAAASNAPDFWWYDRDTCQIGTYADQEEAWEEREIDECSNTYKIERGTRPPFVLLNPAAFCLPQIVTLFEQERSEQCRKALRIRNPPNDVIDYALLPYDRSHTVLALFENKKQTLTSHTDVLAMLDLSPLASTQGTL